MYETLCSILHSYLLFISIRITCRGHTTVSMTLSEVLWKFLLRIKQNTFIFIIEMSNKDLQIKLLYWTKASEIDTCMSEPCDMYIRTYIRRSDSIQYTIHIYNIHTNITIYYPSNLVHYIFTSVSTTTEHQIEIIVENLFCYALLPSINTFVCTCQPSYTRRRVAKGGRAGQSPPLERWRVWAIPPSLEFSGSSLKVKLANINQRCYRLFYLSIYQFWILLLR